MFENSKIENVTGYQSLKKAKMSTFSEFRKCYKTPVGEFTLVISEPIYIMMETESVKYVLWHITEWKHRNFVDDHISELKRKFKSDFELVPVTDSSVFEIGFYNLMSYLKGEGTELQDPKNWCVILRNGTDPNQKRWIPRKN